MQLFLKYIIPRHCSNICSSFCLSTAPFLSTYLTTLSTQTLSNKRYMLGRISTDQTGNSSTVPLFVYLLLLLLQDIQLHHVAHPVQVLSSLLLPPATYNHKLMCFIFCLAIFTAQIFFAHISLFVPSLTLFGMLFSFSITVSFT